MDTRPPNVNELVAYLREITKDTDPLGRVAAAQQFARQLEVTGDQVVGLFVGEARAEGCSWSQIGDAMNRTKQAVQQRWQQPSLDGFSNQARHVVSAAREAAQLSGRIMQTGDLLRALFDEQMGGHAERILDGHTSIRDVESELASIDVEEPSAGENSPFSISVAEVLRETPRQARKIGHVHIGSEHILLALASREGGHAYGVLSRLGLTPAMIRDEIIERLDAMGVLRNRP
ncbi:Clp protease N-terminal domain-containing protein [Nonomuraea typhae]|uniref:Clp protease N-terminal domain-containing protein n=1 Tax=Nonomuraea typhae TaxID=2603600 RepID=UPI0012FCCB4C|nr:Clp protease N-terminal domain-containing protein [Nonomuraea typhae]